MTLRTRNAAALLANSISHRPELAAAKLQLDASSNQEIKSSEKIVAEASNGSMSVSRRLHPLATLHPPLLMKLA